MRKAKIGDYVECRCKLYERTGNCLASGIIYEIQEEDYLTIAPVWGKKSVSKTYGVLIFAEQLLL